MDVLGQQAFDQAASGFDDFPTTGHILVDDEFGGAGRGCSDPKYCRDGRPKPFEELKPTYYKSPNRGRGGRTSGDNPILIADVSCNYSDAYNAGTVAHEAVHFLCRNSTGYKGGSLLEEYVAHLVGEVVRYDLVGAGYGDSSKRNINLDIEKYTVNLNNPDRQKLERDLINWFDTNRSIYTDSKRDGGHDLRPLPPFWAWPY